MTLFLNIIMKVAYFGVVVLCVAVASGCRITDYVDMGMMERLVQSTYVVYGRTIYHSPTKVTQNGQSQYVIEATYQVHCIFREGEDPLSEEITIEQISPALNCSGTDVTNNLKVGDYSIIALKKATAGKYLLQEVMPEMSATFYPMKPYFFSIANTCFMQAWKPPVGASTNRCPICGVSNFDSEVTTLDNSAGQVTNCEYTTDTVVSDMSACDVYIKGTIDYANVQTCIPASFNQSCVHLLYRVSTATCDCTPQTTGGTIGTGGSYKTSSNKFVIASLLLLTLSTVF